MFDQQAALAEEHVDIEPLRKAIGALLAALGAGWAGKTNRWELDINHMEAVAAIREAFRKAAETVAEDEKEKR